MHRLRIAEHRRHALKFLCACAVSAVLVTVGPRRRFAAALLFALQFAGCKGGDTHHSGCEERGSSMICQCPDARTGRLECVDGHPGDCLCDAPSPAPDSGSHESFGNSDGGPPRMLPDAMVNNGNDQPDAHAIMVDTTCGEQESQALIG